MTNFDLDISNMGAAPFKSCPNLTHHVGMFKSREFLAIWPIDDSHTRMDFFAVCLLALPVSDDEPQPKPKERPGSLAQRPPM